MRYGVSRRVGMGFDEAMERVRAGLQAEGFGVLFEIDLREKMREKLGVDFRRYVILGACNPGMAYRALQEEIGLGLLLPCNVVVYEEDEEAVVAAIDAREMLAVTGNESLSGVAGEVDERLRRVVAGV
jgi:uncharacterized protein (DUF302 family)